MVEGQDLWASGLGGGTVLWKDDLDRIPVSALKQMNC